MKTANLQFNFHAVKLLASAMGAALEPIGDIPDVYMPICGSLVRFFLAADKTQTWSYAATLDEHMFLRVSLGALIAVLMADAADDEERAKMVADIDHLDNEIKARARQMQNRALH